MFGMSKNQMRKRKLVPMGINWVYQMYRLNIMGHHTTPIRINIRLVYDLLFGFVIS